MGLASAVFLYLLGWDTRFSLLAHSACRGPAGDVECGLRPLAPSSGYALRLKRLGGSAPGPALPQDSPPIPFKLADSAVVSFFRIPPCRLKFTPLELITFALIQLSNSQFFSPSLAPFLSLIFYNAFCAIYP